jgi:hypothetical protein
MDRRQHLIAVSEVRPKSGHVGNRATRVAYALVSLVVGSILVIAPATGQAATEKRRFVAWKDGHPAVQVERRRELDCTQSSYLAPRLDAWRCFGRRYLYDPCFENLAEDEYGELLCVSTPWADSGVLAFSALDYDALPTELRGRPHVGVIGLWAGDPDEGERANSSATRPR